MMLNWFDDKYLYFPERHDGYKLRQRALITSTGRTGTHFLAAYFNHLKMVPAAHQPNPGGRDLANDYARGRCDAGAVKDWLLERDFGDCLEVTPFFWSIIGPFRALWPEARIVVVTRDPVAYTKSAYHYPGGWYQAANDHIYRVSAPEMPGDGYGERWGALRRFEKIAWLWRAQHAVMARDLPDDALVVRFEDIFAPPHHGMAQISAHLGVEDPVAHDLFADPAYSTAKGEADFSKSEEAQIRAIASDWAWSQNAIFSKVMTSYLAA